MTPVKDIDDTPSKSKGRPKGTVKKKGFKGTPKKLFNAAKSSNTMIARDRLVGLTNNSNVCFFNSVMQSLFSLQSFRNHVISFTQTESDAVNNIKDLFESMETSDNLIRTHECVQSLPMPGYAENHQFDAQECMGCITNLFYPRVDDKNDPMHNMLPNDCLFGISGEESILCYGCNEHFNKPYRTALCQIEFPEPDVQTSIQLKIEGLTHDSYGQMMDELYDCSQCKPNRTLATRNVTMMNVEKYLAIQLKIFKFDRNTQQPSKIVPNIFIDPEFTNELLGTFKLRAIVYHSGNSSNVGHYKSSVKYNNTMYTISDGDTNANVDFDDTPYIVIYEKDYHVSNNALSVPVPQETSETIENEHPMDISNVSTLKMKR